MTGFLAEAMRALRRSWRRVLVVEVGFKALGTLLVAAASSAMLAWIELRSGGAAVTNVDLVGFLTRPVSILLLLLIVGVAASLVLVEHAVLLSVLGPGARALASGGEGVWGAIGFAVARVARLALLCVGVILAVVGVALGLIGATYVALLGEHDINYYLATKPPEFVTAASIAGVVAAAAAGVLAVLLVRWILALPITIFEGGRARDAIRTSRERVSGRGRRIALSLLAWHGTLTLLALVSWAGFRPMAARSIAAAGDSPGGALATIIALLALHNLGAALISFLSAVGHALIVLRFYEESRPEDAYAERGHLGGGAVPEWVRGPAGIAVASVLVIGGFLVPAVLLVARLGKQERIEITAHRGASRVAPENTLSAVRAAIESGADWAEIDVQETKDGHVVVLHDQDLMRLGGDPRRIADLTLEEARTIDVGTKFDPEFAGERIPTLDEVLDLADGKIRLNIELKYYGSGDPRLARDVARILRERDFAGQCVVASLDYASLGEARAEWADLRTAAIVSARVGDPTRLDVHTLSMGARLVDVPLLRSARRRGKEVLVWTINDPTLATRLMELGVDNLITDDPAPLVRLRDERRSRSRVERLVTGFRVVLGAADGGQVVKDEPIPEL